MPSFCFASCAHPPCMEGLGGTSWRRLNRICATHLSNGSLSQQHKLDTAAWLRCGGAGIGHVYVLCSVYSKFRMSASYWGPGNRLCLCMCPRREVALMQNLSAERLRSDDLRV